MYYLHHDKNTIKWGQQQRSGGCEISKSHKINKQVNITQYGFEKVNRHIAIKLWQIEDGTWKFGGKVQQLGVLNAAI